MSPSPIDHLPVEPDERHDPRCAVRPCTCETIARRVREADAARARAITAARAASLEGQATAWGEP